MCHVSVSVVQIGVVKDTPYFGASVNFCPYFARLPFSSGEIRYRESAQMMLYLACGRKLNYIYFDGIHPVVL
jgi:hypothetical protein